MREIRFRAWLPDSEIMLSDITIYSNGQIGVSADDLEEAVKNKNKDWHISDDGIYHSDEEHFDPIQNLLSGDDWYWIDDAEVMQYTGLKDKNGKEIYEGDIVKYIDMRYDSAFGGNKVCVQSVEWNDDGACFFPMLYYCSDIEVIGNIYENSELLDKEVKK